MMAMMYRFFDLYPSKILSKGTEAAAATAKK